MARHPVACLHWHMHVCTGMCILPLCVSDEKEGAYRNTVSEASCGH